MINLPFIFTLLITFVFPLTLFIYLLIKHRKNSLTYIIGFLTFFIFQIIFRLNLLTYIANQVWYIHIENNIFLYALYLGIGASLFEEIGRFIMMKLFIKEYNFNNAIIFGLGHWACEALMLVGINYLVIGIQMPNMLPEAILIFLSGIERLLVIPIHIGCSLLVMKSLANKQYKYLLIALLIHFLIDAASIILSSILHLSTITIELFIALCALALSIYIYKERKIYEENI